MPGTVETRKTAIVTGADGPAFATIEGSLRKLGFSVYAIDSNPHASGILLVQPQRRLILPPGDDPNFAEVLLATCAEVNACLVIPTDHRELIPLVEARDRFLAAGVKVLLPGAETVRLAMDKQALIELCRHHVPVPWSRPLDELLDRAGVPLPAIIKPRSGAGSRGIRVIQRVEELDEFSADGSLLVQELLPGTEYSIDVLALQDGDVIAVIPRTRLRVNGGGVAVAGASVHDDTLEAIGETVARIAGLTSVANIQVKTGSDGRPALLEMNPRIPGTLSLSVASGVDMVGLACRDLFGERLPRRRRSFDETAVIRSLQDHFCSVGELEELEQAAARWRDQPSSAYAR
jgi:carbamoyl-phosphate synthase large subunit